MAKALNKKKPGSSLYEYGEKTNSFYQNSSLRNEMMPSALGTVSHHKSYIQNLEKATSKKGNKSAKRVNNKVYEGPQNVYYSNNSPGPHRQNGIGKKKLRV